MFLLIAGAALAVVQALAAVLVLGLAILLVWAVCFRTREIIAAAVTLTGAYLLAAHPGWFVAISASIVVARIFARSKPSSPPPRLLPPPSEYQPHR